jgi:hypothetical protein
VIIVSIWFLLGVGEFSVMKFKPAREAVSAKRMVDWAQAGREKAIK